MLRHIVEENSPQYRPDPVYILKFFTVTNRLALCVWSLLAVVYTFLIGLRGNNGHTRTTIKLVLMHFSDWVMHFALKMYSAIATGLMF